MVIIISYCSVISEERDFIDLQSLGDNNNSMSASNPLSVALRYVPPRTYSYI